ncbi:MAG: ABC transporter ATP-binding protein [Deltaproteobacteria bacterium]|nr:ABC transporter ATP-binding protein [Deltaproteobacteria bacterium]
MSESDTEGRGTTAVLVGDRLLRQLLFRVRYRLLLGIIGLLVVAASDAFYALLSGPLLTGLLGAKSPGQSLGGLIGSPSLAALSLATFGALLVGTAAIKGIAHVFQAVVIGGASETVGDLLRRETYRCLLELPLAAHRQLPRGELITRLVDDTHRVQRLAFDATLSLLRAGVVALALSAVALWLAPRLALICFAGLPLLALTIGWLTRRVRTASRHAQAELGELGAQAEQGLAAIREVKSAGAERSEIERLAQHSADIASWARRRIATRAFSPLVNETLAALALVLGLVFVQGVDGLQPERLVSFFTAVVLMYRPIKTISQAVQELAVARASSERLAQLYQLPSDEAVADQLAELHLHAALELREVTFRYGETTALAQVELSVAIGKVVCLIGPSGAGKSTLANVLCGLEPPVAGSLVVDGRAIEGWPLGWLRQQAAFVPQQPLIFRDSLGANLRYGTPEIEDAAALAALEQVGLGQWLDGLPSGLNTRISAESLSGGEAQRIGIARALLRPRPLLVLDEPSAALDQQNERAVIAAVRAAAKTRAVVVIAHRNALREIADQIVELDAGRLVERRPER